MRNVPNSLISLVPGFVWNIIRNETASKKVWLFSKGHSECVTADAVDPLSEEPPQVPSCAEGDDTEGTNHLLLYDLMRVRQGKIMFEADHLNRIRQNCALAAPVADVDVGVREYEDDDLLSGYINAIGQSLKEFVQDNSWENGDVNLKFVTWGQPSQFADCHTKEKRSEAFLDLPYAIYYVGSFFPPEKWYSDGTRFAILYDAHRHTPNAKIMQLALRERAKSLQKVTGAFEVLMVSDSARHYLVPEGSRSNYLIARDDGSVLCSLEEDILVGITLRATRRAAAAAGLPPIQHQRLLLGDICMSRNIAMLGTSPGILPVKEIQFYYDEESKQQFLTAMDDYLQRAENEESVRASIAATRDAILAEGGLRRLESPQCDILKRLRAAYEAEALQ
uniref:Aminotransferase class IV n=1 Tax=Trypanosoma congolense (strain IL3000) TaxID=1068625 RepID=G0UL58_TRYCI|nr:conserved hypothetical protein [Trypanosoma congolense IL3000]